MLRYSWIAIPLLLGYCSTLYPQAASSQPLDASTRNYDQKHLRLELSLNFDKEEVSGTATLQLAPLQDQFREIVLHCKSTSVYAALVDGEICRFAQADTLLHIYLNREYRPGEVLQTEIHYTARPATGLYFFHPSAAAPEMPYQVWSQGEGEDNSHWFPCYDKPDDKLSSELLVTVPANMQAFSNGRLIEVRSDPDRQEKTFHWKTDFEHSAYLISLIAGEYITISDSTAGVPLHYNIPADLAESDPQFAFRNTPHIMKFFSSYLVPYPYQRYDQTAVQDFRYGGMENTTATTLNRRIFHAPADEPNYSADALIAHEMAHQWFGDLLTCRTWKDIWLNEGITSYFTDLYFENSAGQDDFVKRRFEQNESYLKDLAKHPLDSLSAGDGSTPIDLSGGRAYSRGAAVTHMLRYELGDSLFRAGMKAYVNKYRFANVTSEDLRHTLEEVSGKDLSQFFRQWVYGAGCPRLEVSAAWDAGQSLLTLTVRQLQDSLPTQGVFQFSAPLEFRWGNHSESAVAQISQREQQLTYRLERKPELIRFDRHEWILKDLTFHKSFSELSYQLYYDNDVAGRYRAARQLTEFGDRALPVLRNALRSEPFYWVRSRIVKTLGQIGGSAALDALQPSFSDPDARVREQAMKALRHFEAADVQDILRTQIENDESDYVRGAAAATYGRIKADGAFELLQSLLTGDSHRNIIRSSVFDGMKYLDDPRALPLVKEYVRYGYSHGGMHLLDISALECADSLAARYRAEALEAIAAGLDNPYFRTRIKAAQLLAKLNATEMRQRMEAVLQNERRNFVKTPLEKALAKLSQNTSR